MKFLSMPFFSQTRSLIICLILLPGLGCQGQSDAPERAVVSGNVTWKGEPIPSGTLRLLPTAETLAPPTGAEILNGKYTITNKGGAAVGTYRVEITAERVIGDVPPGEDYPPMEQYLPEQYNTQSTLTFTVPSGTKKIQQDFELRD